MKKRTLFFLLAVLLCAAVGAYWWYNQKPKTQIAAVKQKPKPSYQTTLTYTSTANY